MQAPASQKNSLRWLDWTSWLLSILGILMGAVGFGAFCYEASDYGPSHWSFIATIYVGAVAGALGLTALPMWLAKARRPARRLALAAALNLSMAGVTAVIYVLGR